MARSASDVLAVLLLQKENGVKDLMRVVPLFETLDDLTNATDVSGMNCRAHGCSQRFR